MLHKPLPHRGGLRCVRIAAILHVRPLRLILRRFLRRLPMMGRLTLSRKIVGRLEVVLTRNVFAVAQPVANNVGRELLGQFRLSGTPQVVEQPRPGRHASPLDDPFKLRSQVAIPTTRVALRTRSHPFIDHVNRAFGGQVEGFGQDGRSSGNRGIVRVPLPR